MEVPFQKGSHIAQTILARFLTPFLNKNQENDHQNMEKSTQNQPSKRLLYTPSSKLAMPK